jgi:hypothetical protein
VYQIKRCKECGKKVHVHKVGKQYRIKDIQCEHIPAEKQKYATSRDVEKYTSSEIPRNKPIKPQEQQKPYRKNRQKNHHKRRH